MCLQNPGFLENYLEKFGIEGATMGLNFQAFAVISFCIALAASAPPDQKNTGYPSTERLRHEQQRTENQLQGTVGLSVPLGTERASYMMSTPPYHDLESQLQSPHVIFEPQS